MSHVPQPDVVVDGILNPGERDRFVAGCQPFDPSDTARLRRRVLEHLIRVEAAAEVSATVDAEAARRLGVALLSVLDDARSQSEGDRALVMGAVSYFVDVGDGRDDLTDPTGFDDDVRVANAVFDVVGRHDLLIELL